MSLSTINFEGPAPFIWLLDPSDKNRLDLEVAIRARLPTVVILEGLSKKEQRIHERSGYRLSNRQIEAKYWVRHNEIQRAVRRPDDIESVIVCIGKCESVIYSINILN